MDEVALGPVADVPEGEMRQYQVDGEAVLVCNIGGKYHAIEGTCPHRGAMLAQGQLHGTAVVCPWHEWAFDVTTGRGISNPVSCLKKYELIVRKDQIVILSVETPA
ncbi:MAG: Rieske (2Fe-2S) protein [Candidatus Sumerlaeaceae bacterium]